MLVKWRQRCEATLTSVIELARIKSKVTVAYSADSTDLELNDDNGLDAGDQEKEDFDEDRLQEVHKNVRGKRKRESESESRKVRSPMWLAVHEMPIILPSSCDSRLLKEDCMKAATDIEIELRKSQAGNSLDELRTYLITSYTVSEQIKQHSARAKQGLARTTRHVGRILSRERRTDVAAGSYRRAYKALVALGVKDDRYKPLRRADCRVFVTDTASQLGNSRKQASWIWQKLEFLDNNDVTKNFSSYAEAGEWRAALIGDILKGKNGSDQSALVPDECIVQ